jgi:hypothetical protein
VIVVVVNVAIYPLYEPVVVNFHAPLVVWVESRYKVPALLFFDVKTVLLLHVLKELFSLVIAHVVIMTL